MGREFLKIRGGRGGLEGDNKVSRGHRGSGRSPKSLVGFTRRLREGSVGWGFLRVPGEGALMTK